MDKQGLIKQIKKLFVFGVKDYIERDEVLVLVEQLDEPETGHADEAPRYVKNILARLRELPLHDREVWLKAIMDEFEQDFSSAKWREGYEQGKFEGKYIPEKVKVPQFVADWIDKTKGENYHIFGAMKDTEFNEKLDDWFWNDDNMELFARAWLDGYTIEEKRYRVKMKAIKSNSQYLVFGQLSETWWFGSAEQIGNVKSEHTHKEIEDAGFGEVFNSPLFEVEEVTE